MPFESDVRSLELVLLLLDIDVRSLELVLLQLYIDVCSLELVLLPLDTDACSLEMTLSPLNSDVVWFHCIDNRVQRKTGMTYRKIGENMNRSAICIEGRNKMSEGT
ncbi:hypothetical protein CWR48_09895 [Oceanobacillus arenosus]|uniref:Uncharacterized protein n=1 Tax=Oceanobacillus arenosus TaxID=1229153 RepID=A0A3D8PSX9_9BACI|nr:hypothetical protein CWR48_09895 [Oceanobacillus arenosus]